ncbi:cation:proton antiporter [Streptomyces sp. NPDC046759]|uniref:cation:proton antiporter n=1 Tax=Streptomyces sp. NPDC046759 TaxID=3155019 RepID=UPI0033C810F4
MTGNAQADLFLVLALVIAVAKLLGGVLSRLGQPPVVGEIVAGILASPMVLSPAVSGRVLPADARPALTGLADVGLATFMFLVGLETKDALPHGGRGLSCGIAAGGLLLPLVGRMALALPLASAHAPGSRPAFVLFVGVAMCVTAVPVLARILADHHLGREPTGTVVLVAAAVTDVAAWVCLAAVIAYAHATVPVRLALLPLYALVMAGAVRPLLAALMRRAARRGAGGADTAFLVLAVGLLGSAAATEWLGIHFIFGAFAFGATVPRSVPSLVRAGIATRMRQTGGLLFPLYFFMAGGKVYFFMAGGKVDIAGFSGRTVLTFGLLITVATATKTLGAYAGAQLSGAEPRQSLIAAVLMNTRGLTEIVILSTGLELHLIDQTLYS